MRIFPGSVHSPESFDGHFNTTAPVVGKKNPQRGKNRKLRLPLAEFDTFSNPFSVYFFGLKGAAINIRRDLNLTFTLSIYLNYPFLTTFVNRLLML